MNSAERLEAWLLRVLEVADEVVLLVDDASSDATLDIARTYADAVHRVEHPPFIEWAMDWGMRRATGDWILWLDDDELLHPGFRAAIEPVLADRRLTHAYLQSRAVVESPGGGHGWLRQFPWYPDPRLRLVRNVGSVFRHRGRLHSPFEVDGDGVFLEADEVAIHHMDLLWRTRAEREAKVERYRGNNAPSCEEYYLFEDYASALAVAPLDAQAILRDPAPDAVREGARRRARPPAPEGPVLSLDAMRRHVAAQAPGAQVFSAEYLEHTVPATLGANRGHTARVTVRNTSEVPWRASGAAPGWVTLRYHWRHPERGLVLREGDRSLLPDTVAPGETVTLPAGFWTPFDPGAFLLELDLRCEGVGWFSEHGVAPLRVPVQVTEAGRVLARPRPAAELPPEPPAAPRAVAPHRRRPFWRRSALRRELRTRNAVPLGPVRVLDTRDGTGAPGAVLGPVAAGATVTLELTEPLGIPGHATGVLANLAVPQATYNGFVSTSPGEGGASGFVSVYFNDRGDPTVNQVALLLGPAEGVGGRVSLHLSDNHPGTAELILDVVGYLT